MFFVSVGFSYPEGNEMISLGTEQNKELQFWFDYNNLDSKCHL